MANSVSEEDFLRAFNASVIPRHIQQTDRCTAAVWLFPSGKIVNMREHADADKILKDVLSPELAEQLAKSPWIFADPVRMMQKETGAVRIRCDQSADNEMDVEFSAEQELPTKAQREMIESIACTEVHRTNGPIPIILDLVPSASHKYQWSERGKPLKEGRAFNTTAESTDSCATDVAPLFRRMTEFKAESAQFSAMTSILRKSVPLPQPKSTAVGWRHVL
jgi:hypothetical protein